MSLSRGSLSTHREKMRADDSLDSRSGRREGSGKRPLSSYIVSKGGGISRGHFCHAFARAPAWNTNFIQRGGVQALFSAVEY